MKTHLVSTGLLLTPEVYNELSSAISWLRLTSGEPLPANSETTLDAFCHLLETRLVYEEGERDMVAMHHEFGVTWGNGEKEKRTSTMIAYGDLNSYSAMAKTVGYPAAIATDMILQNQVSQYGVIAPMSKSLYEPMIIKLHDEGIRFTEATFKLSKKN